MLCVTETRDYSKHMWDTQIEDLHSDIWRFEAYKRGSTLHYTIGRGVHVRVTRMWHNMEHQSKQRQDKSVRAVHIRQETGSSQNIQNRIIVLGAGGHSRQNCGAPSREIPCQEIVRVSRITFKACICVQRAATASLRTPH